MIKLYKSEKPEILKNKGETWKERILLHITKGENPSNYLKRRYAHPQIKNRLINETSGKCAYCESQLTHIAFGHIEHIIPKSKFPEQTFEWNNLTLACEVCNINKGYYYNEKYMLLNPYKDCIEKEIVYLGCMAYGKSNKGLLTIKKLDLNRVSLVEKRIEKLRMLNDKIVAYNELSPDDPLKEIYQLEIEESGEETVEYSCVMKNAIQTISVANG